MRSWPRLGRSWSTVYLPRRSKRPSSIGRYAKPRLPSTKRASATRSSLSSVSAAFRRSSSRNASLKLRSTRWLVTSWRRSSAPSSARVSIDERQRHLSPSNEPLKPSASRSTVPESASSSPCWAETPKPQARPSPKSSPKACAIPLAVSSSTNCVSVNSLAWLPGAAARRGAVWRGGGGGGGGGEAAAYVVSTAGAPTCSAVTT